MEKKEQLKKLFPSKVTEDAKDAVEKALLKVLKTSSQGAIKTKTLIDLFHYSSQRGPQMSSFLYDSSLRFTIFIKGVNRKSSGFGLFAYQIISLLRKKI